MLYEDFKESNEIATFNYLKECLNENNNALEKVKKEAQQESRDEEIVVHVNKISNNKYVTSDFYDTENTVCSYGNGEIFNESLDEAKKIQYKRKYTDAHPAKEVGLHGKVRDRILEVMSDKKMTQEEFDNIIQEFNLSKRWVRNNSNLFKVKGGMVALSETGRRIWKVKAPKINESVGSQFKKSQKIIFGKVSVAFKELLKHGYSMESGDSVILLYDKKDKHVATFNTKIGELYADSFDFLNLN
jgi:hypothetical protein